MLSHHLGPRGACPSIMATELGSIISCPQLLRRVYGAARASFVTPVQISTTVPTGPLKPANRLVSRALDRLFERSASVRSRRNRVALRPLVRLFTFFHYAVKM